MKIYTRDGDDGGTGLFGGERTRKNSLRVEAYGAVDETNSFLGLAASGATETPRIRKPLGVIQARLFDLGAHLATPPGSPGTRHLPGVGPEAVTELERWIDEASQALPPLTHFVLPGGVELAARLHVARTVCRRAERRCVALAELEAPSAPVVPYLNRLGDLLFVFARLAAHLAGAPEVTWVPSKAPRAPEALEDEKDL